MPHSKIIGTGSYLPAKTISNADLERMVDTTDEWIMQRVGIRKRHICSEGETCNSMAFAAAERAIQMAGIHVNDIDLILVGTASPDYYFPSTACNLQHRLGITTDCAAMDVNAACAGFIYALSVGNQYIKTGQCKNVLVVGVDALSKIVDWTDRSVCVLFGDGAGAVVLQASDEPGIVNTVVRSAGKYGELLYSYNNIWRPQERAVIQMDGHAIFKLAVRKLGDIVTHTLAQAHMTQDQIDWLVPHQANHRIIAATAKRLGLPLEQVILTIEEHGNTSAASIPLALDYAWREGQIKSGDTLMFEAFGAGLAWGAAIVNM